MFPCEHMLLTKHHRRYGWTRAGDSIKMVGIVIENGEVSALYHLADETIEANAGITLTGGWIAEAVK